MSASEPSPAEAALARAEAQQKDLLNRIFALVAASASLLRSPRVEDVLPAIVTLARQLIAADGYAVWQLDPLGGGWSVASYSGVSEEFASAVLTTHMGQPAGAALFTEPIAVEDVNAWAMARR